MLSGSGEAAHQFATVKVTNRFESSSAGPLFSMTRFNGWPESLEHHCTVAWGFMGTVISKWAWASALLLEVRSNAGAGITAYYHLLSFLNFVALAKAGRLEEPQDNPIRYPQISRSGQRVW